MKYLLKSPDTDRRRRLNKIVAVVAGTVVTALGQTLRRTRRKAAAQKLEEDKRRELENSEKFQLLADNLSDAFWIRSPDMKTLHYVSRGFEKIWGRTVETLHSNPAQWIDFVYPDDRPKALAAFATLAAGALSMEVEYRITRPDGELRWILVRGFPVRDASGTVIRHTGMIIDTTERKRIDEALRTSEHQHRKLAKQIEQERSRLEAAQRVAKVGSWETDMMTLNVVWSSETYRIYETDPMMFAPTHAAFIEFIHPDDRDAVNEAFAASMEKRIPSAVEHRIVLSDGRIKFLEERWQMYFDESGTPVRALGTCQDITERKRTEAMILETEASFRLLSEAMPQIVWTAAPDGQNSYLNQQWVDYTGVSVEDGIGRGWMDAFHPDDRARATDAWRDVIHTSRTYSVECRLRAKNGEYRWWLIRAVSMKNGEDKVLKWVGTCTDIHDLKLAELEISRTNRVLQIVSACNEALVSRDTEEDLIERACEIAVEIGGYAKAWVEYVEDGHDADKPNAGEARDVLLPMRDGHHLLGWLHVRPREDADPTAEGRKLLQEMTDSLTVGIATRRAELERRRVEAAMVTVAASVSAATSNVFFEQLVRSMAEALGAQGGFVAEFLPDEPTTARSIAAVANGNLIESFDYTVAGTPCEHLLTSDSCVMAEGVAEQFPHCERLVALRAQGYVGRRLDNSAGKPVGLLFVVFKDPLHHVEFITSTLQIFAARAAAEMERQQTDIRVREQAALLEIAREAIMVKDMDNRIIYWNKGAERIYGWTAEEAIGRDSLRILYSGSDELHRARSELLERGEWDGELTGKVKSGRDITVHVRWTLVRDANGNPKSILAINTDITEMKKLESQFLRAQRMEGIGTLASGMAHDLNNVLAPILLATEMLRGSITEPDDVQLLTTVQTSAQRGAELVKQVLSFARGVEGEHTVVNPLELMGSFLEVVRETFPKSVQIKFTSSKELWTVTGDATQMNQIFLNLCINARDAMPNGGRLTIGMSNVIFDDTNVSTNPDCRPGAYVMVSFEDTGAGIPPEICNRIFEPFFTTKDFGKGTGLGLSTTLGILKSHGGFIDVHSEVEKGTTFKIYFTANSVQLPVKTVIPDEANRPRGNGETILVVDDEASIRNVTKRILERFGYRVILASNGTEALQCYAEHGSEIAAVLTDMSMPVMDGAATILALREINPTVRVIGSSGLAFSDGGHNAGAFGLRHFITKPYTAEAMLRTLKEVLSESEAELLEEVTEIQMMM
jgi:PAS domain S-box-containing protein